MEPFRSLTIQPSRMPTIYFYRRGLTVLNSIVCLALCLIGVTACEQSEQSFYDEYARMMEDIYSTPLSISYEDISDISKTDKEVFEVITELIRSGSERDFEELIQQLYSYAHFVETHEWTMHHPPPVRNLRFIPGLRDLLVQKWYFYRENIDPKHLDVSVDQPNWSDIPKILSVLFPGDPFVYKLIWDAHEPSQPASTIARLDNGGFVTQRANELRIRTLLSNDPKMSVFKLDTARSLGISQSEEGLEALVTALSSTTDTVLASLIVEAIVAHGYIALPHKKRIEETAKRLGFDLSQEMSVLPEEHYTTLGFFVFNFSHEASENRILQALADLNRMSESRNSSNPKIEKTNQ